MGSHLFNKYLLLSLSLPAAVLDTGASYVGVGEIDDKPAKKNRIRISDSVNKL